MPDRAARTSRSTKKDAKKAHTSNHQQRSAGDLHGDRMTQFLASPSYDALTPQLAEQLQRTIGNHALQRIIQREDDDDNADANANNNDANADADNNDQGMNAAELKGFLEKNANKMDVSELGALLKSDGHKLNKKVRTKFEGIYQKRKFVAQSGGKDKGSQNIRKAAADKMDVITAASATMQDRAGKLLNNLASDTGGHAEMGPLKNMKGIFSKMTRKHLGKDKQDKYDPNAAPVELDDLGVDIKDIVRGTIYYEEFDDLQTGYMEMVKGVKQVYKYIVIDIIKSETSFDDNQGTGYRDAKLVLLMDLSAEARKILKSKAINTQKFRGIPFEIQLNLKKGLVVKSGKLGGEENYLNGDGLFDGRAFVQAAMDEMGDDYEQRDADAALISDIPAGGLPKAHEVYKMPDTELNKQTYNDLYVRIYEVAYRANGYIPDDTDLKAFVTKLKKQIKSKVKPRDKAAKDKKRAAHKAKHGNPQD